MKAIGPLLTKELSHQSIYEIKITKNENIIESRSSTEVSENISSFANNLTDTA